MSLQRIILIFQVLILVLHPGVTYEVRAQEPVSADADADTRVNPVLDNPAVSAPVSHESFSRYPFLNLQANRIRLNGSDWGALARKFDDAAAAKDTVNILVIGDSHVQADGNTGRMRRILQADFGNAGRGLMIPFRVAGTNNPLDYKISTANPVTTAKLMKMPWPTTMGFTGIAVHPEESLSAFTLRGGQPFNSIRIYGEGAFTVRKVLGADSNDSIPFKWSQSDWGGTLALEQPASDITVTLHGGDYTLFGFDARAASPGVLLHAIGNNGATFSTYSLIGNIGKHVAALEPDLVIISLGTNEAFGKTTDATFRNQIDRLVNDIKHRNPQTQLLLVTPAECQRSVYSRSRKRRRRTRTFAVNTNVARMRNVILDYAREHNIAVYDFYDVAGAEGASAKWLQNKLLSGDRIHRTWAGYYLEGELMADALEHALKEAGLKTVTDIIKTPVADASEAKPLLNGNTSSANAQARSKAPAKRKATGKRRTTSKKKTTKRTRR